MNKNKSIFARTPRLWMQLLSHELGFEHTHEKVIMLTKQNNIKSIVLEYSKSLCTPPIEWLINYDKIMPDSKKFPFIIEMGSKLLKTNKKYICYVENGFGLFSFNTKKINKINTNILRKRIEKENFLGFVFYSNAARLSTKNLFISIGLGDLFTRKDLGIIYPYSGLNKEKKKKRKSDDLPFNILFCSSSFELKGGRELLSVFNKLKYKHSIKLTIITSESSIKKYKLSEKKNITAIKFSLNNKEYINELYNADIVVHPTYFDTHALSLLDAIKIGIPVIATNTFAINDMIINYLNGIIIKNPYQPYSVDSYQPTFKGRAINFMEQLISLPKNEALIEDLSLALDEMLSNYNEFVINIKNTKKLDFLNDEKIIKQWNSLSTNFRR